MKTVLVLGGSGYLGQFLVQNLTKQYKLDLPTGEGMQQCFDHLGPVDVVINCAAISSPAACEKEVENARAINVPTMLLDALDNHKQAHRNDPLLIQLSTDQVYDGSRANWRESDMCHPVNAYGRTKLEAEQLIQFIANGLRQGKPTTFFEDEFRCPIYVKDIVQIINAFVEQPDNLQFRLFNMGGPERLSRLAMAYKTADCWDLDKSCIISALSASVKREVVSPADISMDSTRLAQQLPAVQWTSLSDAMLDIEYGSASRQQGVNSSKERLGQ